MGHKNKEARVVYQRYYYDKNKQSIISRTRRNKKRRELMIRSLIEEYKKATSCFDCSIGDVRVLEFDHLKDKKFNIGDAVREGYSWLNILKEIKKCEVVCANCHRIRTHLRKVT
jgi:hypothetical protein